VVAPKRGGVFEPPALSAVYWLTEQGWQLPHSIRVDSVTNFQHTWAQEDVLVVEDLVDPAQALSPERLRRVQSVALNEPLLAKKLIAPNAQATAVNVTIRVPESGGGEEEVARAAYRLAAAFRAQFPDQEIAVTGSIPLMYALQEAPLRDMTTLLPAMYAALLVAMFLFLRSVWGVVVLLLLVALAAGTAMGAAGWLGIMVSPPMSMAPTIILTIAIADGIHILVTLAKDMRRGQGRDEALVDSLRVNWQPVFLTSLTTVIGFLSLNLSDVPPFQDLGNATAIGVLAAWFYSVTFLPAFVAIVPYRVRPARSLGGLSMDRFAEWLIQHQRRILPAMIGFTLLCAAFVPRIEFDDMFIDYFDDSAEFRRDTLFAIDRLSGIYQLHYSLGSAGDNGINEPAYLKTVDSYAQWLRAQPEVDHVSALPDTMKRLNKNMHGDDDSWYRLPESRELAAQYLLLYEMSLPYGLDLNNQIDIRKSATKVTATLENMSARELREFNDRAVAWLDTNANDRQHDPRNGRRLWPDRAGLGGLVSKRRDRPGQPRPQLDADDYCVWRVGPGRGAGWSRILGRCACARGDQRRRDRPLPEQVPAGSAARGSLTGGRGPLRDFDGGYRALD
jgi:predicted RND superfamily exporter protein